MATRTDICNLALGHLAVVELIDDIGTGTSVGASACRQYFDTAVRKVLRAHDWPFATRTVQLSLIRRLEDFHEWTYLYAYPSDCARFRKILSNVRNDSRQSKIAYKIETDGIRTDRVNAVGRYTVNNVSEAFFPADFELALSYYLAALIAPQISKGDEFGLGINARREYASLIGEANANSLNEEQEEEVVEAELVRSRF